MEHFSQAAFERLLFPLHKNVYKGIDKAFIETEEKHPGSIDYLCALFDLVFSSPTTERILIPENLRNYGLPIFDICIDIAERDFSKLRKTQNYATFIRQHDESYAGEGIHLIISLNSGIKKSAFIVPVQLIMSRFEKKVCSPGSYQVYEHTLIRKQLFGNGELTREKYLDGSASYIGITKRSWQQRLKEHTYASRRGSQLLFHKALRGDLFPIETFEHQVLRAGVTEKKALNIEELEVEQRTLNATHPNGLNMIPGGEAGIRFMASMTKKKPEQIDPDKKEVELEEIINSSLRQEGIEAKNNYKNEKLAQLWRENIKFRINAMTNRADRLSYRQILNARIWGASGWDIEKIHKNVKLIEERDISEQQIQNLLNGKTYETIPHVLVDADDS